MRMQFAIVLLAVVAGCWTMKAGSDVRDSGPQDAASVRDGTTPNDIAAQTDTGTDSTDILVIMDVVDATTPSDSAADAADIGAPTDVSTGTDVVTGDMSDAGTSTAPRQIAPMSTATVTSQTPTLHWVLAMGTDGAHVQVCRDRPCGMVEQTYDVTGASGAVPTTLTPGVHYWHVASRTGTTVGTTWSATWEFTVGHRSAPVDTSAAATDLNGDGYADIAVGSSGAAYVYLGGASGPVTPPMTLSAPVIAGDVNTFSGLVVIAGDVNGDGYADAVVNSETSYGVVIEYLYLGGAVPLGAAPTTLTPPSGIRFIERLASVGDVNGDGYADLVAGNSVLVDGGAPDYSAYVYLGGSSGFSTVPLTLAGPIGSSGFGSRVSSAGDINGDGYADIVVTGAAGSEVYLFLGRPGGPTATPVNLIGPVGSSGFGAYAASAGDVDGDGYGDLIIGAGGSHTAYIYLGGPTGPTGAPSIINGPGDFGAFVAGAGDVNGDGYADVVVSEFESATAYVFLGGATGLSPTSTILVGPTGLADSPVVVNAGDVNGDGFADLIVDLDPPVNIYLGGTRGLATTPITLIAPGGAMGFGESVAVVWDVPTSTLFAVTEGLHRTSSTRRPRAPYFPHA